MANIEHIKDIEKFFIDKININYEKFKEENSHLSPNFYFLLLAIRVDKVKSSLNTQKNLTRTTRYSTRTKKRKRNEYYEY